MIRIISYGTENTHGKYIKRLKESCEVLGYPHYLKVIPDNFFKEGRFKYLYKPTFIRETLEKLNEPVIWMDADSLLIKAPALGKIDFDFGYVRSPPGSHKWFADSCHIHAPSNISFLKQWEVFCSEEKGISDHTQLIRTFECTLRSRPLVSFEISSWFKGCYIRNYKRHDEIHY